jgi:mRNA interferase YafQ
MREIERTTQFKRDDKREQKGRHRTTLEVSLCEALCPRMADTPLAARYRDHALSGEWSSYSACHIRPDLVLIYEKPDATTLRLIRIGSHSELGL